jgi:hypothetical protein
MEKEPNHCVYVASHDQSIALLKIDPFESDPASSMNWRMSIIGDDVNINYE